MSGRGANRSAQPTPGAENVEMAKSYSEEIVVTQAADGIELAGAVISPAQGEPKRTAVVWIHGYTGRFYEPHALIIGRRFAERGYTFITGNNRGNNYGSILHVRSIGQQRLGGAAWEKLDESPLDVDAWIDYAISLGHKEVILIGHSLGGMKVTYYMATRQDKRVKALVNASGPVWRFIGPAKEDVERAEQVEQMMKDGKGLDLIVNPSESDNPSVSVQNIQSGINFRKILFGEGPDDKKRAVSLIRVPMFAFIGTEEPRIGNPADLDWLKSMAVRSPNCEIKVFEGCDHLYTGHEVEVADAIACWFESIKTE